MKEPHTMRTVPKSN